MIYTRNFHVPVLLSEVVGFLKIKKSRIYVDATLGGGGYAEKIVEKGGILIGIDCDKDAIKKVLSKFQNSKYKYLLNDRIYIKHGNYSEVRNIVGKLGFKKIHGAIFDLGLSSYQIDESGRGFSYLKDEPLDMRMCQDYGKTAAYILNNYQQEELYEIFSKYSEELNSRSIAKAIAITRSLKGKFEKTSDLKSVIFRKIKNKNERIKVLSRIFQALRIEVNNELENLKRGLDKAIPMLAQGGRLCVLSYHSIEDRIVKIKLNQEQKKGVIRVITKKPVVPTRDEIKKNRRARSAKLRVAEKL